MELPLSAPPPVKKIIAHAKTRWQDAIIAETRAFGRSLIIDGELQSAARDEFIYHEALVHPAMALHRRPREVLVLGGGEGATVREILRHSSVRRVTMVDLDGEVVQLCRRYLPQWGQGAWTHRKLRLLIADAKKFILETREQFDIIISDLPTPTTLGPLAQLYRPAFYQALKKRLKPDGLLVVQSGSGSLTQSRFHVGLCKTLKRAWNVVRPYYAFVPSFDVPWAFIVASQKADPRNVSAASVNRKLGTMAGRLRFYDGETHEGLFRVPKYMRALVK